MIQLAQGKAEAIRLVNEAAERYFRQRPGPQANGDDRKLCARTKIIITEHSTSPTLPLGSLPVSVSSEKDAR